MAESSSARSGCLSAQRSIKAASKSTSVESMSTSTTPAEGRALPMDVSADTAAAGVMAWERGAVAAAAGTGVVGEKPEDEFAVAPAPAA